jgi:hypothetical protein
MFFYEEEVIIIPANKSCKMALDKNCGIYECPVKKGQYRTRAENRALFMAFRNRGSITHLYKLQDVLVMRFNDNAAIKALGNSGKYKDIEKRIQYYLKNMPSSKNNDLKYVFILDLDSVIELPYVVSYSNSSKGKSGHEYRKLHELIKKPKAGKNTVQLAKK